MPSPVADAVDFVHTIDTLDRDGRADHGRSIPTA